MTKLDIRLLGEFAASNGSTPLTTINSQRLQCLLAYLLLHRDAPVARQRLAFLFWPDSTEPQARSNLRNLLHTLCHALNNGEQFIESDSQTVRWRADSPYTLDVDTLLTSLESAETAHDLQRALAVYRGPLLPSCYDDWIVPEREKLEQRVADTVQQFIDRLEREGDYRNAITFAQQLVRRDPLREDLYRQIMRLFALSGDRAGVARTFKECRAVLKNELDVEPSRQTVQAYEKYKSLDPPGDPPATAEQFPAPAIASAAPSQPPSATVRYHLSGAPAQVSPSRPVVATGQAGLSAPADVTVRSPSGQPVTDAMVRKAVLSDALQHPATEVPLALAAVSGLFLLLYVPALPALPAAVSVGAWAALVLSALAAAGSFILRYVTNFDAAYAEKARVLQEQQQGEHEHDEQAALIALRTRLAEGFRETKDRRRPLRAPRPRLRV